MRRGNAFLIGMAALGLITPSSFAQYPYPYGPMPYGPSPLPAYLPPAMVQPVYYAPAPMPTMPMPVDRNAKVFVYGPLTEGPIVPAPRPIAVPPPPMAPRPKQEAAPTGVTPAQLLVARRNHLPTYSKADVPDACAADDCGAACAGRPEPYEAPMRGKGHFIGDVGAYFFVPFFTPRTAFVTTPAGGVGTFTEFGRQVDIGPRATLGYVFHTGWGVRADYRYLRGSISAQTANADPTATVALPGFGNSSPGPALAAGVGVDQFVATQRLELNVGDVEIIKESHVFDTTLLFSFGGRYARFVQSYAATRTNPGGAAGGTTFALDQQNSDSSNRYAGWGPTVALEAIHPLRCGFALYGDVRGSFLFGNDRFTQAQRNQSRTVNAAGVPTFTDTFTLTEVFDSRFSPSVEVEAGVQYGHRLGRCYLFARAGAVYQRWWDIGNPSTANGNLTFLGGTARLGIAY